MEKISFSSLVEALKYWESLLPLRERWKKYTPIGVKVNPMTREELMVLKILEDKPFYVKLENFWKELKLRVEKTGEVGKIKYWNFIGAETYEETIERAFMASFLFTYGYATLEIHPLEEEIFIKPYKRPDIKISRKQLISIPISITREDWIKWKVKKND